MQIPREFCWTRFGTEAGETSTSILERKEVERLGNGGTFLWGIGNSIRPSLTELVRLNASPAIVFSPMLSKPAPRDVDPAALLVWDRGVGLDGRDFQLPTSSVVTSSCGTRRPRSFHFALVCESDHPLTAPRDGCTVRVTDLRNLLNGTAVGSSQVTSVVRRLNEPTGAGAEYRVQVVARLRPPYLVRLIDPVLLPEPLRKGAAEGMDWVPAAKALFWATQRPPKWEQEVLAL